MTFLLDFDGRLIATYEISVIYSQDHTDGFRAIMAQLRDGAIIQLSRSYTIERLTQTLAPGGIR